MLAGLRMPFFAQGSSAIRRRIKSFDSASTIHNTSRSPSQRADQQGETLGDKVVHVPRVLVPARLLAHVA
jgi:hypothetical protein